MRKEPLLGFLLLIVIVIVVISVNQKPSRVTNTTAATTSATPPRGVTPSAATPIVISPADEISFIAVVNSAIREYGSAKGDLAQGSVRPSRKNAISQNLRGIYIKDWVGKVSKLTTNNEGKGVVHIKISDDMSLGTWNNSLSDIGDHTLIEPDSNLYQTLKVLQIGQTVRFTGGFFRDNTDCIRETSLSVSGSMQEPEFLFRFSDIQPEPSLYAPVEKPVVIKPTPAPLLEAPPRPVRATIEVPATVASPPSIPQATTGISAMYQKGFQDRVSWEQWFAGLSGDFKLGAFFWSAQRSLKEPGSCRTGNDAFYQGCTEAKSRLAGSDVLRKSEPDYKLGWNAYPG